MKKGLLALLFVGVLCLSGCQSEEKKEIEAFQKAFETVDTKYSEAIKTVMTNEWAENDGEDIYVFTQEGTGDISGETFTYSCGFDAENKIAMKVVMDETKEEKYFYVSTDKTGYGLNLDVVGSDEDLYLMRTNIELIALSDERAAGIVGEWADKSDNRYVFREDGTMVIKGSASDIEGTFSLVKLEEEGNLIFTLLFANDIMDFYYEMSEDGSTMKLCRPGTDVIHTWTKQ